MKLFTKSISALFAVVVFLAATGVPQVIHLCTTVCDQVMTCCDEPIEAESGDDCCSDIVAIHKIEVLRGAEASGLSVHPHLKQVSPLFILQHSDLPEQHIGKEIGASGNNNVEQYADASGPGIIPLRL